MSAEPAAAWAAPAPADGDRPGRGEAHRFRTGHGPPLALVDFLKALACVLIVLHHLAFYGPMADHARVLFPALFDWLAQHARVAVQIFLVIGGYLAARSLDLAPMTGMGVAVWQSSARRIRQRFLRLSLPLWVVLGVAVLCNAWADHWMDHPSISGPPDAVQILAHVLLLQDITGHEALSAGLWYVAIDFQLYALLTLMAAACRRLADPQACLQALTVGLMAASALVFNRDAGWDAWAVYHAAAYGLGVVVGLKARPWTVAAACALLLAALVQEFRIRLALALATGLMLQLAVAPAQKMALFGAAWIRHLSRISYSVFLIHFPVCLVVNAAWTAFLPAHPGVQLLGVVTAVKLSLLAGWMFHQRVEMPWMQRLRA